LESTTSVRTAAFEEANAFCTQRSQASRILNITQVEPNVLWGQAAKVDVHFECESEFKK
jgi:hypothetical protein